MPRAIKFLNMRDKHGLIYTFQIITLYIENDIFKQIQFLE